MTGLKPRERINDGISMARLRMEGTRAVLPTFVLVGGGLVTLAILAFLLTNISATFGRKTYELRFAVSSSFGVFPGFDDVRFRGVPAGTIAKVERRGEQLVLVAKIRSGYGPIFRNARAELRPITPLNDMYLDIVDPGTPRAGELTGAVPLPAARTAVSVTVPEVLDTLNADQRVAAAQLLDNLGNGMADGGMKLRAAFVELVPFLREAGAVSREIATRQEATTRLVHNTAVLTTELAQRETELRRLVATGSSTLKTLQDGRGDLDATLTELGPTVTELRTTLANVRGVLGDVDRGVTGLYPVADRLSGGLAAVRTLNADLGPAATGLQPPVQALRNWLGAARPASENVAAIGRGLLPQVPTVDRLSKNLVSCEKGIIGFFQWDASLAKWGDATAPVPRGNVAVGVPSASTTQPLRAPADSCTPGRVVRGVPTAEDFG